MFKGVQDPGQVRFDLEIYFALKESFLKSVKMQRQKIINYLISGSDPKVFNKTSRSIIIQNNLSKSYESLKFQENAEVSL